jgi:hypothetical protein
MPNLYVFKIIRNPLVIGIVKNNGCIIYTHLDLGNSSQREIISHRLI